MEYPPKTFESHIIDCTAKNVLLIIWQELSAVSPPSEPRVIVKCPLLKEGYYCDIQGQEKTKCHYL